MNGCNIVGDGHRPTGKFKYELYEHGINLCDSCPLKDCVATDKQTVSLQYIEKQYRIDTAPECDRHVMENRTMMRELARKEAKNAKRNPTGRKRGRPRKERK